jgi:hypothetical protein
VVASESGTDVVNIFLAPVDRPLARA